MPHTIKLQDNVYIGNSEGGYCSGFMGDLLLPPDDPRYKGYSTTPKVDFSKVYYSEYLAHKDMNKFRKDYPQAEVINLEIKELKL